MSFVYKIKLSNCAADSIYTRKFDNLHVEG